MQGIFYLLVSFYGMDIKTIDNIFMLLKDESYAGSIKIFIGLNHVIIFFLAPLTYLYFFHKHKILSFLSLNRFNVLFIPLFLALLLSLYPLMGYLSALMEMIDLPPILEGMDDLALESISGLLQMNNVLDLCFNIILIGVIPGITEELLFRGIIQKELNSVTSSCHLSIWLTAIGFGLLHLQIIGLFPKIIIGIVLGYAYQYSGSLILPMVIHTLNNSLAVLTHYFNPLHDMQTQQTTILPVISVIFSTGLAILIFFYIKTKSKFLENANE